MAEAVLDYQRSTERISGNDLKWMGEVAEGRVYLAFDNGPLSQWYPTKFVDRTLPQQYSSHVFTSSEQYMMLRKALLFGDVKIAQLILVQNQCQQINELGRMVCNFDNAAWDDAKVDIVVRGNYLKFTQDFYLTRYFLDTAPAILVSGSLDPIWGVGMPASDVRISNPLKWGGANLLGKCLTYVRQKIFDEANIPRPSSSAYDSESESESDESRGMNERLAERP